MFQSLQNSNLSSLITLQTLPSYHSILGNHKSLVLIYINFISFQLNSRPLHLIWTSNHGTCTKPTFHILHKVNSFPSCCGSLLLILHSSRQLDSIHLELLFPILTIKWVDQSKENAPDTAFKYSLWQFLETWHK